MTINCPHCGFSREVASSRIPLGAGQAKCPRCGESFAFARPQSDLPDAAAPAGAPPLVPSPQGVPKGGFWIRVAATVVDSILVSLLQFVFGFLLALTTGAGELAPRGETMMGLLTALLSAAIAVFYYVFFTGYGGQTPGKMVVRIKVIRTDGTDIGYGRAFLREVPGKFISGILLGIGYLMVAFDRQKQGLHDKIADTYVIKL